MNGTYMPTMKEEFEQGLRPIFRFIENPSQITFDDDIVLLVKNLLKKTHVVTPDMWEMFDHFPKVITKSKGQLNDTLDTLNYFVMYGKEQFA